MARRIKKNGFTLVELLVVITIIGILISLLLPAVQAAREAARRMQCSSNLKQLALALHNYHVQCNIFPPAMQCAATETPGSTTNMGPNWCIAILPFLEQQALYNSFTLSVPISNAVNREWRGVPLSVMNCPSDPASRTAYAGQSSAEGDNWARGNYGANGGNGFIYLGFESDASSSSGPGWKDSRTRGVMGSNASLGFSGIRDGSSNTMLLAELRVGVSEKDIRGSWALGGAGPSALFAFGVGDANGPNPAGDFSDDLVGCDYLRNTAPGAAAMLSDGMSCSPGPYNDQAGSRSCHPGGVHIALADGSIRFVGTYVDTTGTTSSTYPWPTNSVWSCLIGSSDGYPISGDAF
jgi:prepilin-type N-terminal cleavage/methylation domain-containing protein